MKKELKEKILSKILTVLLIFSALVCIIIFSKIITKSEVSFMGCRFYYILTESMWPTIKPNSLILVKSIKPEKLKEGDIISFTSKDEAIYGLINTHRILQIEEKNGTKVFTTMGDNNPVPDAYKVAPDEIKGKVIFWTPPMKGLTEFLQFSGTKMGFFIVILIPLMFILAFFMRSFVRDFKRSIKAERAEIEALYKEENKSSPQPDILANLDEKAAATLILEQYFGKPLSEVTPEEISKIIN